MDQVEDCVCCRETPGPSLRDTHFKGLEEVVLNHVVQETAIVNQSDVYAQEKTIVMNDFATGLISNLSWLIMAGSA
jgi:hypothetical protein